MLTFEQFSPSLTNVYGGKNDYTDLKNKILNN